MLDKFLALLSFLITLLIDLIVAYYLNYFGIDMITSIILLMFAALPGVILIKLLLSNSSKKKK